MASRDRGRHGWCRAAIAASLAAGSFPAHAESYDLYGIDLETQLSATYSAA